MWEKIKDYVIVVGGLIGIAVSSLVFGVLILLISPFGWILAAGIVTYYILRVWNGNQLRRKELSCLLVWL